MTQPASCASLARRPLREQARALTVLIVLLVAACTAAPLDARARSAPESFSPLVKRVLPAVVNIAVTETVTGNDVAAELPPELKDTPLGREFRRRFGNKHEQMMGAGSGFIIDPSGVILDGKSFKTLTEFKQVLVEEKAKFFQGFAEKLLAYALGRPVGATDRELVEQIVAGTTASA